MRIIVLTGGLGSGKSTAARRFVEHGAVVLDLDLVAREVLESDPAVADRLAGEFGRGILAPDGSVDRAALASAAFSSPERTALLDSIMFPLILRRAEILLDQMASAEEPPAAVALEVPLLAEAPDFADIADVVVAFSAPAEMRVERAVEREMPEADARRRSAVQATDEQRSALADVVIENSGTLQRFIAEVDSLWEDWVEPYLESD